MEASEIEARAEALAVELTRAPGNIGLGLWQVVACRDQEQRSCGWREIRRRDGFTISMRLESYPHPAKWAFRLSWPHEWRRELTHLCVASDRGPKIETKAALERPPAAVARQVLAKVVNPGESQWKAVTAEWESHCDAKKRAESAAGQLAVIGGFGWTEIKNNANHQGEERFMQYHSQKTPLWAHVRVGGWKEDGSCELELRRIPFALTLEIVSLIRAHEEGITYAKKT
jgi:hypothetical protein